MVSGALFSFAHGAPVIHNERMMNGIAQWQYLIGGLVVGLFGWLLYWAGIPVIGGLIGAFTGGSLGIAIAGYVQPQLSQPAAWTTPLFVGIGTLLGAVLGVLLMRAIQVYFFFTVGALFGGTFVWSLFQRNLGPGELLTLDWGVIAAILLGALTGGLLTVYFRRFLVAMLTSVGGAVMISYGLPAKYKLIGLLISLVIFVAVQIGLVRRFVEREAFDHRLNLGRRHDDGGGEE